MTVKELIEMLKKAPQGKDVYVGVEYDVCTIGRVIHDLGDDEVQIIAEDSH